MNLTWMFVLIGLKTIKALECQSRIAMVHEHVNTIPAFIFEIDDDVSSINLGCSSPNQNGSICLYLSSGSRPKISDPAKNISDAMRICLGPKNNYTADVDMAQIDTGNLYVIPSRNDELKSNSDQLLSIRILLCIERDVVKQPIGNVLLIEGGVNVFRIPYTNVWRSLQVAIDSLSANVSIKSQLLRNRVAFRSDEACDPFNDGQCQLQLTLVYPSDRIYLRLEVPNNRLDQNVSTQFRMIDKEIDWRLEFPILTLRTNTNDYSFVYDIGNYPGKTMQLFYVKNEMTGRTLSFHTLEKSSDSFYCAYNEFDSIENDLMSTDKNEHCVSAESLFIAIRYPRAGWWRISYNRTKPIRSAPIPILKDCSNSSCSGHGECYPAFQEDYVFYPCFCDDGYDGLDCSRKIGNATSRIGKSLLLVLSNLGFVVTVAVSIYRKKYGVSLAALCLMIFSTFYHLCDYNVRIFCLFNYSNLQLGDFVFAFMLFPIVAVSLTVAPQSISETLYIGSIFACMIAALVNRFDVVGLAIITTIDVLIMVVSWVLKSRQDGKLFPPKKTLLCFYLPASLLAIAGIVIFMVFKYDEMYWITHSIWHMSMATSASLFIWPSTKPEQPSLLVTNPQSIPEMESLRDRRKKDLAETNSKSSVETQATSICTVEESK